jgi:hypothetical protein
MSCGGGHLGFPIGIKNRNFIENLPMIIPGQFGFNCPKLPMIIPGQFGFNCPSGFREKAF